MLARYSHVLLRGIRAVNNTVECCQSTVNMDRLELKLIAWDKRKLVKPNRTMNLLFEDFQN